MKVRDNLLPRISDKVMREQRGNNRAADTFKSRMPFKEYHLIKTSMVKITKEVLMNTRITQRMKSMKSVKRRGKVIHKDRRAAMTTSYCLPMDKIWKRE